MARKKQSQGILAEVRRDRLYKHLNEVEGVIQEWITDLDAPPPFYWQMSEESQKLAASDVSGILLPSPEYYRLQPWKLWACRSVYVPRAEQDTASNHILHKHLRKRALWRYHTEWEQKLNSITELGSPLCEKATKMQDGRKIGWELTEDYMPVALQVALEVASGHAPVKSYSQRSGFSRGVWYEGIYDGILIEKSASPQQVDEVAEQHWQMISELGQSNEMKQLAWEWQQVLVLQDRMTELAQKAVKSSDILYPCQFCRRLWQG